MVVHRIRDHVRAHHWFATGVDLIIVILGVFIGIEAANWNASRQDRQAEQRYYEQIIGDLDSDLQTSRDAKRFANENDEAADFVLAALANESAARRDPAQLAKSIVFAGYLFFPLPSRPTYDELISTGNLRLLRDPEVKKAISNYYEESESNRQWDAMIRQLQREYWSRSAGLLSRPVLRAVMSGREPAMTDADLMRVISKARARPGLGDQLAEMAAHQEWIRRESERMALEAGQLQTLLRQHLRKIS